MPVAKHSENGRQYYQYGDMGSKYYFRRYDRQGEERAYNRAIRQAQAIHANHYAAGFDR
jgi:hypothetical protein